MPNGNEFAKNLGSALTLPLSELQKGMAAANTFNVQALTNLQNQIQTLAAGAPPLLFPPLPGTTVQPPVIQPIAPAPIQSAAPAPVQRTAVTKKLQLEAI